LDFKEEKQKLMRYSVKQCAYEIITESVKESYSSFSFVVSERLKEEKAKKIRNTKQLSDRNAVP